MCPKCASPVVSPPRRVYYWASISSIQILSPFYISLTRLSMFPSGSLNQTALKSPMTWTSPSRVTPGKLSYRSKVTPFDFSLLVYLLVIADTFRNESFGGLNLLHPQSALGGRRACLHFHYTLAIQDTPPGVLEKHRFSNRYSKNARSCEIS